MLESFVPTAALFRSPCDFARRMPEMVSYFLSLEETVGRRFREDTISDAIVATLLDIGGRNVVVLTPDEKQLAAILMLSF